MTRHHRVIVYIEGEFYILPYRIRKGYTTLVR